MTPKCLLVSSSQIRMKKCTTTIYTVSLWNVRRKYRNKHIKIDTNTGRVLGYPSFYWTHSIYILHKQQILISRNYMYLPCMEPTYSLRNDFVFTFVIFLQVPHLNTWRVTTSYREDRASYLSWLWPPRKMNASWTCHPLRGERQLI